MSRVNSVPAFCYRERENEPQERDWVSIGEIIILGPRKGSLLPPSLFPLTCPTRRMKGSSQNRLAPLTHQSKHTSVLAQNIILSKMTAIRFGHRTHRSKRAHKALHRTLSPV